MPWYKTLNLEIIFSKKSSFTYLCKFKCNFLQSLSLPTEAIKLQWNCHDYVFSCIVSVYYLQDLFLECAFKQGKKDIWNTCLLHKIHLRGKSFWGWGRPCLLLVLNVYKYKMEVIFSSYAALTLLSMWRKTPHTVHLFKYGWRLQYLSDVTFFIDQSVNKSNLWLASKLFYNAIHTEKSLFKKDIIF